MSQRGAFLLTLALPTIAPDTPRNTSSARALSVRSHHILHASLNRRGGDSGLRDVLVAAYGGAEERVQAVELALAVHVRRGGEARGEF